MSRRDLLGLAGVGAGLVALGGCGVPLGNLAGRVGAPTPSVPSVEVIPGLYVRPRSAWGADLPPTATTAAETVEFLLVHHTASPNDGRDPRDVIRSAYAWHTSAAKGWPDVCYHFFVGPDGSIWEGRAGSIAGPVVADATGGNQGFAQLVCLIGDFADAAPTPAAQDSLVRVLAWLRWRYALPTGEEATTRFVSRGSNTLPAGTVVTMPVIAPHRDASSTECPGDVATSLLPEWRGRVAAIREPALPGTRPYGRARRLGRARVGTSGDDARPERTTGNTTRGSTGNTTRFDDRVPR